MTPTTQTARGAKDLLQHYAEVRARLYGRRPVTRRPSAPTIVLPIPDGRSLAEVPDLPTASTPCPLNMLACPSWRFLLAYVAAKHGVDKDDILSPRRAKELVAARNEAIYLARTHVPGIGLTRIGLYFNRDHSTILSTLRRYQKIKSEPQVFDLSKVSTGDGHQSLTSHR